MRKRSSLALPLLAVASLATMGVKCSGDPSTQVSLTATPAQGPASLNVQFDGDVTVAPPFYLLIGNDDDSNGESPEPAASTDERVPVFVLFWYWEFGDGGFDVGRSVHHTYKEPGSYTVKLTVLLSNGMSSSIQEADIECGDPNPAPADYLTFDGYTLTWHGSTTHTYTAFTGPPDELYRESEKDIGPVPQGMFTVNPANIEYLEPTDPWGEHRVMLEPHCATVHRMVDCFGVLRTRMYLHGGTLLGTHGCVELNDDLEESDFFTRLADYGAPIELEIRYVGDREANFEEPQCPFESSD
ncbi:MAG: PKD domain-containing protein [Candidatus Hydrogenedentes bacterium]|nr:PKD domain-containing protein [Candidatus Hydrogenedentota bacterium]